MRKIKTKSRKLRILSSVHFVVNISSSLFLEDKILCETVQMRSHGLPLMWIVDGPHKSQGSTTTWRSLQASLCAFEETIKSFSPVQILSLESYSWFSFGCGVNMQSYVAGGFMGQVKNMSNAAHFVIGPNMYLKLGHNRRVKYVGLFHPFSGYRPTSSPLKNWTRTGPKAYRIQPI